MIGNELVSKKIDRFISEKEKSRYAFAKNTGINTQTLGNIIDRGDLKLSLIYQIVRKYPDFFDMLKPNDKVYEQTDESLQTLNEPESTYNKQKEFDVIDVEILQSKIEALEQQLSEKDRTIAELTKSVLNLTELINIDTIPTRVMDNSDKRLVAEENRKKIDKAENDK